MKAGRERVEGIIEINITKGNLKLSRKIKDGNKEKMEAERERVEGIT